ncbi:SMEK domain-containing protein [Cytobacillus horneckiae]|uniref:SMEK domain-containing protein n=1 Tax=Cytobacillus horneckiae TaxID=549687 RepID=UPI002DBCC497|nr:SMEK domain-containing protein [Cytobacillus horneckiae]MEC1157842.1 SMEK domain-containing protein [Cytobacillus horneckiae]MED2940736.1 SMEK domain-containing protein [Cytobacillus horneckiae]
MIKIKKRLEEVDRLFSILAHYIEYQNSKGLFDINKYCEDFFCELLNKIYDMNLENLNSIKVNFPAVDLGDYEEGVCFQVTSSAGKSKIEKTVAKFIENGLQEDFEELYILILGSKKAYKSGVDTDGNIEFDIKKNVIDLKDLVKRISILNKTKVEEIIELLKDSLNDDINEESYLSGRVVNKSKMPVTYESYLDYYNVTDKEEADSIVEAIKAFIDEFETLDTKTREVVYAIIEKKVSINHEGIYFNHVEVMKFLRIGIKELQEEFKILQDKKYVTSADDNGTDYERIRYWTGDWELLHELVEYVEEKKGDFKKIFVDLDFTLLD